MGSFLQAGVWEHCAACTQHLLIFLSSVACLAVRTGLNSLLSSWTLWEPHSCSCLCLISFHDVSSNAPTKEKLNQHFKQLSKEKESTHYRNSYSEKHHLNKYVLKTYYAQSTKSSPSQMWSNLEPHHPEHAQSHLVLGAKQSWAWLVIGRETDVVQQAMEEWLLGYSWPVGQQALGTAVRFTLRWG